jgi:DNA helicase-2/ATP-dependent DNA helicase PcrA
MRTIIYGPPGTGKTYTLLEHIEKFLNNTDPDKIGYFTFSKNAAEEGKQRASEKFNLDFKDLPYFQTLHSFCFNQLGLSKNQVMKEKHYKDLGEKVGVELEGVRQDDDYEGVFHSKNPYIQLIGVARSKEIDPIKYYHQTNNFKISLDKLEIITNELKNYKEQHGLIDFSDMIEKFLEKGTPPKLRVMFVDEAQDLSLIQWKLVRKIEESSNDSFIAGDDDQGIYKWNGAHVNTFINLKGTRKILEQSQRVPKKPFMLADRIISKVRNRVTKKYLPKEFEGDVQHKQDLSSIDFSEGKWLVLATANYLLKDIGEILDEKDLYWQRRNITPRVKHIYEVIEKWNQLRTGVPMHFNDIKKIKARMNKNWDKKLSKDMPKDQFYDIDTLKEKFGLQTEGEWYEALDELGDEDINKILKLIKSGEDLTRNPRIKISTIHGVKGNERENVVVTTDLSASHFYQYKNIDPDEMHRLFYVACTRTENNLFIIEPQTRKYYDI